MPMRVADFLAIVNERALALLLEDLGAGCTARISSVWLWLHYHDKRVHYEVWLARKTGRIEIGLHFEGPREFSYHWAALMAPYMPEIQARLGPQVELEEWTASWARVHQTLPYDPLTEALADAVAHRLAEMITVLQPIVDRERENVPPELATMRALRPATPGARFKRRAASKRAHPA